jgi:hypothetical protein
MPPSPQLRFLARASILATAILAVWWWLLLTPVLAVMRAPTEFALRLLPGCGQETRILTGPDGQWSFAAPPGAASAPLQNAIQEAMRGLPDAAAKVPWRISSKQVVCARTSLSLFSLSLPLYWSILLAAPPRKSRLRAALGGSALAAAIGFVSLLLFFVKGTNDLAQFVPGAAARFALDLASYLGESLLPYAAPLLIAIWLNSEFRDRILSAAALRSSPAQPAHQPAARSGYGPGRKGGRSR